MTRRNFLAATSLALAAHKTLPQEVKRVGPNDTITLGLIGVGGRGYGNHIDWFGDHPDVKIVAVCDVHAPFVERARKKIAEKGGKADGYHDHRQLLERKDIDAVVVTTPPHWHSIIAIDALNAGKDVYCEKPLSRYPAEMKLMAEIAAKNKRVTQDGTQIHATANYHRCVDVVRSGVLGKITAVRNFCAMNDDSEGLDHPPDTDPPAGLDWNRWLGPAPEVPFNTGRFRDGMHRYFADYVDSWLHELGPHIVDLPFWALDLPEPGVISASGGRYATDSIATVPDTMDVIWEFPDRELLMTWTMMQQSAFSFGVGPGGGGRNLGIVFHGKDATLLANYGLCELRDKTGKVIPEADWPKIPDVTTDSPGQEREWLNAIKTRAEPPCSFAKHRPLTMALNLAHTALRTGRTLHWNPEKFEVTNDKEATARLYPAYRAPWSLPK